MNDQVGLLKEAAKIENKSKRFLTRVDGLFAELKDLQKENESLSAKLAISKQETYLIQ